MGRNTEASATDAYIYGHSLLHPLSAPNFKFHLMILCSRGKTFWLTWKDKKKKKNRRWRIRCSWNCALRWRGVHLLLRLLLIILWLPKKGRDAARTPATCVWYNTWRTTLNVFFPLFLLLLLPSSSTLLWNNNTFEHQKKRHHATAVSLFTLKKKKELLLLLMNGSIFWRVMASQVTATNGRRSSPGCADCFLFLSKVQMKRIL